MHHTGTPNDITDYAGLCRGILANETSGEYIDIAYNWLIDPNGRIYEGRWAQNYPAGAAHTGERNGANVRGAHAIYNNSNTIGIALMGTYDTINPSPAMVERARHAARVEVRALGHRSDRPRHVSSRRTASSRTSSTSAATATRPRPTAPAQRVEPMLPAIRAQVASRITGAGYWIATEHRPGARRSAARR